MNNDICNPICGDGYFVTNSSEECDDGNLEANDGCSPLCEVETYWQCSEFDPPYNPDNRV